jgi:hypothetical protein
MIGPVGRGTRLKGTLLLADISGYTGFLQGVADAHNILVVEDDEAPAAYALVSSLLDAMVSAVSPPFRLIKFEGDALFAVAEDGDPAFHGAAVTTLLDACHDAFRTRLAEAKSEWTCTCGACSRLPDLGLKFVVHHGAYVTQRIAMSDELAGPDVIVAHRLLKNHARELIGAGPYALLTDEVLRALDVAPDGMIATTESYEDLPPVPAHVLRLH